ncbi:hypothetical protein F4821DRAFT_253073 [Hypoxylon rubiginosum]|uniref:Uncharacterized protein n=1 Tax=Hypoxylon rubiginosum TaxID=110542 RepID=A0ACC0DL04_9PEZI|nr:hypothetical protein F4821DRAFT_253073 [Hypoxylon rubiginosum]
MASTSTAAPARETSAAHPITIQKDETSAAGHDTTYPGPELRHVEMRDLLDEFKKLREEHGAVLALLQKMLDGKKDEETDEKALVEISKKIAIRRPETVNTEPLNDISEYEAPESTQIFESCMKWLGATVKPLEERMGPLPQVLLNTSMDDIKKGNEKKIYSLAAGLSNEAWSFLQTEIKMKWPTEIIDIVLDSTGKWPESFPRGIVIIRDYIFSPKKPNIIRCEGRLDMDNSTDTLESQVGALWVDSSLAIFDFNIVATILLALKVHTEFNTPSTSFLAFHATPWPAQERRIRVDVTKFEHWASIHFRSFVSDVKLSGRWREDKPMTGLRLEREHACFSRIGGANVHLSERRYSLAVKARPFRGDPFGNFTIMALVDLDPWDESIEERYAKQDLENFNLLPCHLLIGIAYFQYVVCITIMQWSSDWNRTLLRLEESIAVKVNDVLDEAKANDYMYDNEQLERSRFYFTLLQLLRIFSEWIANDMASSKLAFEKHNAVTLSDMIFFGLWNDYIETSDIVNAINIIKRNWHVVLALHEKEGQALLDRIARDIQTVESLRDGLFNAQSVREALKGTKLNRFLFVFTVVTIIFLPPSFVSTFYGMHLFDGVDGPNEQTQNQFWKAFISVTAVTYILAGSALLGVQRYTELRNWFTEWWHKDTSREQKDRYQTATSYKAPGGPDDEGEATGSVEENKHKHIPSLFRRQPKRGVDVERANKGEGP